MIALPKPLLLFSEMASTESQRGGRGRGLGGVEPDLGVRAETGCQEPRLLAVIALVSPALSLEKAMAPHSSTLAWKIPWMEEPGGLQSMGLLRVGHD